MPLLVGLLFAASSYLAVAPLPKSTWIRGPKLVTPFRQKQVNPKLSFDQKLHFIYGVRSQLLAGATHMAALKFALNRLPAQTFATTRSAIEVQADVSKALISDSLTHDFPAVTEYVVAMEASSASGGSATQSLSELTHAMLKARSFEQQVSAELASTKATVFILAGLPIIGSGLSLLLGSQSLTWLLQSTSGRVCLTLGITLEILGWLWVKHLLARALQESQ
jgi:tight adherence protein B